MDLILYFLKFERYFSNGYLDKHHEQRKILKRHIFEIAFGTHTQEIFSRYGRDGLGNKL